ncbi:uncharacterized protein METZ01_LOCUS319443, partial [marine metagenome]
TVVVRERKKMSHARCRSFTTSSRLL